MYTPSTFINDNDNHFLLYITIIYENVKIFFNLLKFELLPIRFLNNMALKMQNERQFIKNGARVQKT